MVVQETPPNGDRNQKDDHHPEDAQSDSPLPSPFRGRPAVVALPLLPLTLPCNLSLALENVVTERAAVRVRTRPPVDCSSLEVFAPLVGALVFKTSGGFDKSSQWVRFPYTSVATTTTDPSRGQEGDFLVPDGEGVEE